MYGPHSRYRDYFDARDEFDLPPRFNVAPSAVMPVIRQIEGQRVFVPAKWGSR